MELIPYAALLTELLGSLNTAYCDYGELENALNIYTGGFNVGLNVYFQDQSDAQLLPKLVISVKAMNDQEAKLFELLGEIVNQSIYQDPERLKALLNRRASQLEANVKQNGFFYTFRRLTSYYTNDGMFDEMTSGIQYYWFIAELAQDFDQQVSDISEKLTQTAQLLFNRQNLVAAVTCQETDLANYSKALKGFIKSLPNGKPQYQQWQFTPEKKNEGFLTASKVQYVMKGYDFKRLGYQWSGKMRVLDQVLSSDWLQTQIRVIGGAYGGWSGFASNGKAYFGSYRDPNLMETLRNYDETPNYLHEFNADENAMTRFIIGTIATMDSPLTPSQMGDLVLQYYYEGTTRAQLQQERQEVLSTTAEDIRNMAKLVSDILEQDAFCVYGNEEKIKAAASEFKTVVPLLLH